MSGEPFPKERQLARGTRRYHRKTASPKQWAAIIAAKGSECRCTEWSDGQRAHRPVEYHHLVPRSQGGDDTADNIVPLCHDCHAAITARSPILAPFLAARLTDAEHAYAFGKFGLDALERLFGVSEYERGYADAVALYIGPRRA